MLTSELFLLTVSDQSDIVVLVDSGKTHKHTHMSKELEVKRKRIEWTVKIAALLVTGFVVAPFVFVAIKGVVGLAVAGVIGFTLVNFAPWFATKLANWKLKALKAEATANPIETLENQYKEREEGLVQFRQNILSFHAEVQNFYGQLEDNRDKLAPNAIAKFEEQYGKMKALLDSRGQKYKLAQKNLKEFADLIEQKRVEWNIAQAAAKMSKAAGVGEDFMNKLMTDTAVTSIQTNLNTAFAELEVSLLDEQPITAPTTVKVIDVKPVAALPEKSGPPVLDLDFEVVPEREKVAVNRLPE